MTLKLENLSVGDTIRYSITGKVLEAKSNYIRVDVPGSPEGPFYFYQEDVDRLEVIKKAPKVFKVGDEVEGSDYEKLPVNTVVLGQGDSGRPGLKTLAGWIFSDFLDEDPVQDCGLKDVRTILYLPE